MQTATVPKKNFPAFLRTAVSLSETMLKRLPNMKRGTSLPITPMMLFTMKPSCSISAATVSVLSLILIMAIPTTTATNRICSVFPLEKGVKRFVGTMSSIMPNRTESPFPCAAPMFSEKKGRLSRADSPTHRHRERA